jgi:hypothetical protein
MVMDAFSDSGRLGSYFIKELNTRIYSTYAEDVHKIATNLGLTPIDEEQIAADTAFRLDVLTGGQIEFVNMKTESFVPVRKYHDLDDWSSWPNITHAEGNLDDERFTAQWFQRTRGWGGHHD